MLQNGRGESQDIPLKKERWNIFSHAEGGGGTKCFGILLTQALEVLAMLKVGGGGSQKFPPNKGGTAQSFTLS